MLAVTCCHILAVTWICKSLAKSMEQPSSQSVAKAHFTVTTR
jgi:hypothetical protein